MKHFPVTNSNLSAKHIGLFLQERYSLSQETTCQFIRAGINDTYLITEKEEKYIFRVYSLHWRTVHEIQEELRLLLLLKENNVSISYPLQDAQDGYIQILHAPEGERFGVLFSYAQGEKIHNTSSETHYKVGELMARLHHVTHNKTLQRVHYTSQILLDESQVQLATFLPAHTKEMAFMQSMRTYLHQVFAQADTQQIRQGIVHMDIWFDNLNLTKEGVITIFDFDFCGNGWLCLDIAYYILQLHNIERYEPKDYQPKIDHFLQGYESITRISEEEKRLLPALGVSMYHFYLGIQCQRYENWSNSFLSENYLKRFINGLVKRYCEIYKLGTTEI
jgi:Ser/Thr protein kinase RdoA (MazF antagonist)